ncbi:MAG: Bor family protein [Polyangiaceae bacterium]|jgi:hypothetical protein|nr:Bor family protein [Polyangiaceae bacterium]
MSSPNAVLGELHEEWTDFYIFGLVGSEEFDVHEFCGEAPVAQVRTGGNFGTAIVGAITLGIYSPRKVYVWCQASEGAPPAHANIEIDADVSGRPMHVTRHADGRTLVGRVAQVDGTHNQWRVTFRQEGAQ